MCRCCHCPSCVLSPTITSKQWFLHNEAASFCPEHCTLTDGTHVNTLSIASLCQPVLFYAVLQVCPGCCYLSWTDIPKDQSGDPFSVFSAVSAAAPGSGCSQCLQLSKELVISSAESANRVTVDDVFIAHLRVHRRGERSFGGSPWKLRGDGNWFPRLKQVPSAVTTVSMPGKSRHRDGNTQWVPDFLP